MVEELENLQNYSIELDKQIRQQTNDYKAQTREWERKCEQ